jgi:hypothetical protein
MTNPSRRFVQSIALTVVGLAVAGAGIYIGETDDAPGATVLGIVVMLGMVYSAVWRKGRSNGQEG